MVFVNGFQGSDIGGIDGWDNGEVVLIFEEVIVGSRDGVVQRIDE